MRRSAVLPAPADERPAAGEDISESQESRRAQREEFRTEFSFVLPRGYVDGEGTVHRDGVMRLATARDELIPRTDDRVRENPAWLTVVLLGRVVTRIGGIENVHAEIIQELFAADLAFLQDLYRRSNKVAPTPPAVTSPTCKETFEWDNAGGRVGES